MNERIASLKSFNAYLSSILPGVTLEKEPRGFRFVKGESSMSVTAVSFRNISLKQWLEEARWFNTQSA